MHLQEELKDCEEIIAKGKKVALKTWFRCVSMNLYVFSPSNPFVFSKKLVPQDPPPHTHTQADEERLPLPLSTSRSRGRLQFLASHSSNYLINALREILKKLAIIWLGLHKITSSKLPEDSKELKRCTTKAGLRNFQVTVCQQHLCSTAVYQWINSCLCHWFHLVRKTERKAAATDKKGQNETVECHTWKASICSTASFPKKYKT